MCTWWKKQSESVHKGDNALADLHTNRETSVLLFLFTIIDVLFIVLLSL